MDSRLAGVGGVSRTKLSFLTLRQQKNATFFVRFYRSSTSFDYEMHTCALKLSK